MSHAQGRSLVLAPTARRVPVPRSRNEPRMPPHPRPIIRRKSEGHKRLRIPDIFYETNPSGLRTSVAVDSRAEAPRPEPFDQPGDVITGQAVDDLVGAGLFQLAAGRVVVSPTAYIPAALAA